MVMLEQFTVKIDKYLSYAYTICRCHDQKHDLVNEMFLKLHNILDEEPSKEISDGYIYMIMKSIFIDNVRTKREFAVQESAFYSLTDSPSDILQERHRINEIIEKLPFKDREILLRCQETSRRKLANELGVSVQTICNYEKEAKEKLKTIIREQ